MQRRSLLKLGAAATVVLVLAGGTAALVQPGLRDGRLTDAATLRLVRATLLAPWLAPVLAGALFALWVAAHLVRWVVWR